MTIRRERKDIIPASWRQDLLSVCAELKALQPTRRRFMQQLAGGLLLINSLPLISARTATANSAELDSSLLDPWLTIAAVQEHLFPADEESPGAADINALGYLRWTLNDAATEPSEREFMLNGVGWLNGVTEEKFQQRFVDLNEQQREQALRQIEQTRAGENWLASLLMYLFEALLSDPVYGGNPAGIGWQWLDHQPGFPRPTEKQRRRELI